MALTAEVKLYMALITEVKLNIALDNEVKLYKALTKKYDNEPKTQDSADAAIKTEPPTLTPCRLMVHGGVPQEL